MNFKELRIGYVPYLPDLSQPADRRRFPLFAKNNDVPFEIADKDKEYDIILLTATANLSKWMFYKKKHPDTKFIFEMVDSLILPSDTFSNLFKGVGRFILGKEELPYFDFRKILIKWIKIADVVICSSTKMKRIIEQWNRNVVVSLDYMQNEIKFTKKDFSIGGKMKLVWEGQSVVLRNLSDFKEVFEKVNSFCELHIITDKEYPTYGNLIKKDIDNILRKLPIKTVFHNWEIYKNYEILSGCDCGIIPLNKNNKMTWHKPANKLISFWFAGVPAVVSATPAYVEMMDSANTKLYCSSNTEWVSKIKEIYEMDSGQRRILAENNLDYVKRNYSNQALDSTWFHVFEKAGVLQKE
jgi:hypothetical protein